jgi:nucleoside-diphosphate-sugar epimerase
MTRFVLTGASGALGSALLPRLLTERPDAQVIALYRSEAAARRSLEGLPPAQRVRVQTCLADLLDVASMERAAAALPVQEAVVGIHLAADVSWEKTAAELQPINVGGALRFARFLQALAHRPRLVFVSTAFTQVGGQPYRNGYEETKATAERELRAGFGRAHPMNVYSCSLVVGSSRDGAISRYHGLYPLLRFLDSYSPPFLVGRKDGRFDIVPVDWAVEQLLHAVHEVELQDEPRDVVASAGGGRIQYARLVELLLAGLNSARTAIGQAHVPAMPILRKRQWEFLRRSVGAWKPPGLRERDFRYFERLLGIYGQYAESDAVREPLNTSSPAPAPEDYLPVVIERWWRDQRGSTQPAPAEALS